MRHGFFHSIAILPDPRYARMCRASKLENASPIQQLDHAPGGGHLVTLTDPAGWPVNLIFGQNDTDSATPREDFPELLINSEKSKNRLGACHRFTRGPAAVFRVSKKGPPLSSCPQPHPPTHRTVGLQDGR
jgi:hypothetical protein